MILASHAIIGASVARLVAVDPITAFFAGWISHYMADAVPHWQYRLKIFMQSAESLQGRKVSILSKETFRDVGYLALDIGLGMILALYLFKSNLVWALLAGFGGMLPDALLFLRWLIPNRLLQWHQNLHDMFHTRNQFHDEPLGGILFQIAVVCAFVLVAKAIT